jgi:hypothetical protein
MNDTEPSKQSKGGSARALKLTKDQRSEISRMAALRRWKPLTVSGMPEASHQSTLFIGDVEIDCYVLGDRQRVIHKRGIARALGLKSDGGNAFMKTISGKNIGSAIGLELRQKIENPLVFKPLNGDPAHGYEATVLIDVCDALIQGRNEGKLLPSQLFLARQAEIIVRSAAKIGIIGLIDERTGYIDNKRKDEYHRLFQDYIREEFRQWEKEFPDKFFEMIYRIYGLKRRDPKAMTHPGFFGHFIRKYIYHPLANSNGAILEDLDKKNPVVYAGGGRKYKMFQFLSDEIGLPALKAHLWQVVGIGGTVTDRFAFDRSFYRAFPEASPRGRQGTFQFPDD